MMPLSPIKRGCGYRVAGGVYAECPLAPPGQGSPLEAFLFCPPMTHVENNSGEMAPIVEAWGLSPRGVTLVSLGGKIHVVDIVGRESYPNAADILEEIRRHGLSRRLELTDSDYTLLGPGSKILLAHAWGSLVEETATDFAINPPGAPKNCPRGKEEHLRDRVLGMCAAFHWEGIVEGHDLAPLQSNAPERAVKRIVGDTEYVAYRAPDGVANGPEQHKMALIGAFPIHNLAVIKHPDPERQARAMERAGRTAFDISLDEF